MVDPSRIEQLRRRVQMNPASIAFAALAEEYRCAGQYEEAIATCRAGLRRHPAYLSPRVTLGQALIALGRSAEARAELEYVLKTAPDNLTARRALEDLETHEARSAQRPGTGNRSAGASAALPDPALPALESFLAAIQRVRTEAESADRPPADR
jgi:tetratricopeptide (TPR) repeat protein